MYQSPAPKGAGLCVFWENENLMIFLLCFKYVPCESLKHVRGVFVTQYPVRHVTKAFHSSKKLKTIQVPAGSVIISQFKVIPFSRDVCVVSRQQA
jgi:hypothetical protein